MKSNMRWALVIFIAALVLRCVFLLSVMEKEPFLYGDAFNYDGAGTGIIEFFKNAWPSLGFIAEQAMHGNLGKGSGVLHPLGIHFSVVVFLQGPVYPFFTAAVYAAFGHNIHVLQFVQAVIDSMSCLLMLFAGMRLFGDRRVALAAGILWATYLPAIYFTELVLTETLGTFVFLLFLISFCRIDEKVGRRPFFLSGLATALLMLTRHAFRFIWIVLPASFFFGRTERAPRRAIAFLIGVMILMIPWMAIVSFASGKAIMALPSNKDYWQELYLKNTPKYDGWQPDSYYGQTKAEGPSPYKGLFFENVRQNPVKTSMLYLEKVRRVWDRYSNMRNRRFLLPDFAYAWVHHGIIILGLFGMCLVFARWTEFAWLYMVVGYVTFMSSILHVESRYNFMAMPAVMIFASLFIVRLYDAVSQMSNREGFRRQAVLAVSFIASAILVRAVSSVPFIMRIIPAASPDAARLAKIIMDAVSFALLIPVLRLLFTDLADKRTLRFVCIAPIVIIIAFVGVANLEDKAWHEWYYRIGDTELIKKTINIPDPLSVKEARLLVDMIKPPLTDLKISVNGSDYLYSAMEKDDRMPLAIYRDMLKLKSLGRESIRKWHVMRIPASSIRNGPVSVEISALPAAGEPYSAPVIFGSCLSGEVYEGPSFARSPDETSFVKFGYDGDYRLPWRQDMHNDGGYRIMLEVVDSDGTVRMY